MKKRCRLYPHPWFPFASPIQFLPQVRPLNVKQPRTWSSGPSISSLFVKISPSLVAALLSPVYDSSGREEQNPAVMRFKAVLDAYVFYWTLPLGSALEFSCHRFAFLSPGYSEITSTTFEVRAPCQVMTISLCKLITIFRTILMVSLYHNSFKKLGCLHSSRNTSTRQPLEFSSEKTLHREFRGTRDRALRWSSWAWMSKEAKVGKGNGGSKSI